MLLHRTERLMYQEKRLYDQDRAGRMQECPGYAEALPKRCGWNVKKENTG